MFSKLTKTFAALALLAAFGAAALSSGEASARTTQCWRCTGGWCCY